MNFPLFAVSWHYPGAFEMKFLVAATPVPGHLNPLRTIAKLLVEDGHEVVFNTASAMRRMVEETGAECVPFHGYADLDLREFDRRFPERAQLTGAALLRFYFERIFFDSIPAQHSGFRALHRDFRPDVLIADNYCFGTLPMLLGPRSERPAIVHCGVSYLQYRRDDAAPFHAGFPPATNEQEFEVISKARKQAEEDFLRPVHEHLENRLRETGCSIGNRTFFDAAVTLPDL
jgi:hypothetical protein